MVGGLRRCRQQAISRHLQAQRQCTNCNACHLTLMRGERGLQSGLSRKQMIDGGGNWRSKGHLYFLRKSLDPSFRWDDGSFIDVVSA
jgi:hypothetical protein